MLRLFSNIRKTLINEGKTSRYVRYAVGEVLLIMVGILLALQVQTWNEERKLDHERFNLIENLKSDFQTNLERVTECISQTETSKTELETLLDIAAVDNSHFSVNELRSLIRSGFRPVTFRAALGTYESAQNNGSIALVSDPTLTGLFLDLGEWFSYYLAVQNLDRESLLVGDGMELRKHLGSIGVLIDLWNYKYTPPATFEVSDQEFRTLIGEKEIFAYFEQRHHLINNQHRNLVRVKETTQQILTALEAIE